MLSTVTGWDWFVLLVLLHSIGVGLYRGMVKTLFALSAWVVGLLAVPILSPTVFQALPAAVPQPPVYALIFVAFFVSLRLLGMLVARGVRGLGLVGIDRVLGAALGVVRAAAIVMVAAVIGHLAGFSAHSAWSQALSRPMLDWMVEKAERYLPDRVGVIERRT